MNLKQIIAEEVRRHLKEAFPRNYEPGDRLVNSFGQEIVVTQQRGYRVNAKDVKTGKPMQLEPDDLKDFKLVANKNKPIIVKSGPFAIKAGSGIIMKNGKDVYNNVMYYDDPGYYEIKMPLTDASGRSVPKKSMFFDTAQETVDWFRKTDSKYDWATAMDRIEKLDIPIDYYD